MTTETHPAWCAYRDAPGTCHGNHISDTTEIPATGGEYTTVDHGCVFPRATVYTGVDGGAPVVGLDLTDPAARREVSAKLTGAEARQVAYLLITYAKAALGAYPAEGGHPDWCPLADRPDHTCVEPGHIGEAQAVVATGDGWTSTDHGAAMYPVVRVSPWVGTDGTAGACLEIGETTSTWAFPTGREVRALARALRAAADVAAPAPIGDQS